MSGKCFQIYLYVEKVKEVKEKCVGNYGVEKSENAAALLDFCGMVCVDLKQKEQL